MKCIKRVTAYFGTIFLIYGVFVLFIYSIQDKILYPRIYGFEIPEKDWKLINKNGIRYYWHQGFPGRKSILFFHGNGYGYKSSQKALKLFLDNGYSVLIPEYPGYGGTSGKPGKQTILEMGKKARQIMPEGPVVVLGNSLGSAPATSSALPGDTLIIVSGFAKMTNVVEFQMPLVPSVLLKDKFDNISKVKKMGISRSLLLHAKDDQVVPFSEFEKLSSYFDCSISLDTGDHFIIFDEKIQRYIMEYVETDKCHGNYRKMSLKR